MSNKKIRVVVVDDSALVRGLRLRCPSCGAGHVFARGLQTAQECGGCGWRFERCPGHWVGGNEVNLLVAFAAGVAAYGTSFAALGLGLGTASVAIASAVVPSAAREAASTRSRESSRNAAAADAPATRPRNVLREAMLPPLRLGPVILCRRGGFGSAV